MPGPTKSLEPADRMGVYKSLSEVPDRYRLVNHSAAYDDRDVWQEFCEEYEYAQGNSEYYRKRVDRAGRYWKSFMDDRKRHHALATPADIEEWCSGLRRNMSIRRAYEYWVRIHRFYDWLQWHTEHPHVYNPAMMATIEGETTGNLWEYKTEQTIDKRESYRREA